MRHNHQILRPALILMLLSLAASSTLAVADDAVLGELTLLVHSGEYQMVETDSGTKITMTDCGYRAVPGEPALPVRSLMVALPPGARAVAVQVHPLTTSDLPGTWRIAPLPPLQPLDGSYGRSPEAMALQAEWQAARDAAYSGTPFPAERVKLAGAGTLRKYAYANVAYHPFTWHPQSGRLTLCEAARITVRYQLPAPDSVERRHTESLLADTAADQQARQLFLNFHQMAPHYSVTAGDRDITLPDCDILIITDAGNVNGITNSNYLDWKRSLGFGVKIVLISDPQITGQPGVDLAEQIRNYIRANYGPLGTRYVLLVGDFVTVPMRYCFPNPNNHTNNWPDPGNPGGAVPTDYYYADLSYDDDISWDSDGDGYHGEYTQDMPDFLADVIVGRIPHNYNYWITYALDKMVAFEQDTGDWKRNALNLATIMFYENENHSGDPVSDGGDCMTIIEEQAMAGWNCTHLSEQAGLAPSRYPWPAINETAVADFWREGEYSVVNWASHGWVSGVSRTVWSWDDGDGVPEGYDPDELASATYVHDSMNIDDDHPAIVYSVACSVGYPEVTGLGNLGIHLLCKPGFGGSAGVISATRGAAVSLGWLTYGGGSESLICEFNRLLHAGPSDPNRVGNALYDSKFLCHTTMGWDHYYEYQNMYNFNLYGDPTLVHAGIDPTVETLGALLTCTPSAGTAPFVTAMAARIDNFYVEQTRRAAARIDVVLAGGASYANWRSGWTNIEGGGQFQVGWEQNIPALGTLDGVNIFTLSAVDVTPAPWNQPPYPPAGDIATASCPLTVDVP